MLRATNNYHQHLSVKAVQMERKKKFSHTHNHGERISLCAQNQTYYDSLFIVELWKRRVRMKLKVRGAWNLFSITSDRILNALMRTQQKLFLSFNFQMRLNIRQNRSRFSHNPYIKFVGKYSHKLIKVTISYIVFPRFANKFNWLKCYLLIY